MEVVMGLDMYLSKKFYVGGQYEHRGVNGIINLNINSGRDASVKSYTFDPKKVEYITFSAAYWRKANSIHKWFVDHCQDGIDDCRESYVDTSQLEELRELCKKVLETRDPTPLPPCEGFFFGSSEIDEWYWKDLESTIEMLKDLDDTMEYSYHSSW
jgi:hypothetical protein